MTDTVTDRSEEDASAPILGAQTPFQTVLARKPQGHVVVDDPCQSLRTETLVEKVLVQVDGGGPFIAVEVPPDKVHIFLDTP